MAADARCGSEWGGCCKDEFVFGSRGDCVGGVDFGSGGDNENDLDRSWGWVDKVSACRLAAFCV